MRRSYRGKYRRFLAFLLAVAVCAGMLWTQDGVCQAAVEIDTSGTGAQTDYGISNPRGTKSSTRTWDCIWFGHYWQSDTNDDGFADKDDAKEPILWRVLWVDGDDAFLLSERGLDYRQYHEGEGNVTWETSTMRSWLNGYSASANGCGKDFTDDNFLDDAFDLTEQKAIRKTIVTNDDTTRYVNINNERCLRTTEGGDDTNDYVYLLSLGEAMTSKYGFAESEDNTFTRSKKDTDYAWEKYRGRFSGPMSYSMGTNGGTYLSESRYGLWWLRSPGTKGYESYVSEGVAYPSDRAVVVRSWDEGLSSGGRCKTLGVINSDGDYCTSQMYGIRPVLHIDLSKTDCWSYAGTVDSAEKEDLQDTPSPLPVESAKLSPSPLPLSFEKTTDTPTAPLVIDGVTTWDCVYFGNYWQSDTDGDGTANRKDAKEPIKWRVLSVDGDDALLLADQCIACQAYNEIWRDVTWKTSTVRSWLNGYSSEENSFGKDYTHNTFINYAFTDGERSAIKATALDNGGEEGMGSGLDTVDKVYLLSGDDVTNTAYGFTEDGTVQAKDRGAEATDYVKARQATVGEWWLRTLGEAGRKAEAVSSVGWHEAKVVDCWGILVRPALHLDLSETAYWANAGTVTSDGKVTLPENATPIPTGSDVSTSEPFASGDPDPTSEPSVSGDLGTTSEPSVSGNPAPTDGPSVSGSPSPTEKPIWLVPDVTYDAADFEAFAGRSKEEVVSKYVEARYTVQGYDETDPASIYEEQPSLASPYSAGKLSKESLETMISLCNYYRWLVGSSEIEGDTSQETYGLPGWHEMQRQAFLCNFPTKPDDFPEDKWGAPSRAYYKFSRGATPIEAVKNAVNESNTSWNDNTYYEYDMRKSILAPGGERITMGYSGSWLSAQRIGGNNGGNSEEAPFYSFPSEGYMPNDLMATNKTAWSVRLNLDKLTIPSGEDVSVSVIHRESGARFERSIAERNAYAHYDTVLFQEPAAEGLATYTGTYDVEVTGLLDIASGKGAKLCYTVTFFDASQDLTSEVKEVSLDGIVKFVMPQQMEVQENIAKLTALLTEEVTVTGANGRSVILPVKGDWNYDETNSCWRNSVDAAALPSGLTDSAGILSDFSIGCEVGDNQGLTFEMSWTPELNETNPTDGRGGKITIKRNEASEIDSAVLYQITKSEGAYMAALRYDTKSSWGVTEDGENHAFVIPAAYFLADTGDYVAVGYAENGKTAWLSDAIVPLLVTVRKEWTGGGTSTDGTGNGVADETGNDTTGGTSNGVTDGNGNDTTGGTNNDTTGKAEENANSGEKEQQDDQKSTVSSTLPKVAKVKNVKIESGKKGFALTWKKNSKVSGYEVWISAKKNFKKGKKVFLQKSKARYKVSNLKPQKNYYVRIRAYRIYQVYGGTNKIYGQWIVKNCRIKR